MIWVESIHQWFVQFEKERKQNEKKKNLSVVCLYKN